MPSKLAIVRPTGFRLQCPELATWLMELAFKIASAGDIDIVSIQGQNWRVPMLRNKAVQDAREAGCQYMLMVDPDAVPDRYGGSFWSEAWPLIQQHPAQVLASPAVGPYPDRLVNVFKRHQGKLHRLSHKATELSGWHEVDAVGTHLMLVGMEVFDRIEPPYFHDIYTDAAETELVQTQDVYFCEKVRAADMKVMVNFSCWSGHWQNSIVDPPGMTPQ